MRQRLRLCLTVLFAAVAIGMPGAPAGAATSNGGLGTPNGTTCHNYLTVTSTVVNSSTTRVDWTTWATCNRTVGMIKLQLRANSTIFTTDLITPIWRECYNCPSLPQVSGSYYTWRNQEQVMGLTMYVARGFSETAAGTKWIPFICSPSVGSYYSLAFPQGNSGECLTQVFFNTR